ncbi:MAG: carbamoyltransferase HypF [Lachnospiraceae bacterium]|nr:carbamoyltransferase HypF [Lachnospiraceae bacterium]MDY5498422.1 carbamoyltransferase HypF [Anaerobutyricum sp.]
MEQRIKKCIRVFGIVQGVGFRPTVKRHGDRFLVDGSVCNRGPYVEIRAAGTKENVEGFLRAIREEPPQRAVILKMDVEDAQKDPEEEGFFHPFAIIESEKEEGEIFVSPDIAICPECKKELYDPKNRRYLHPFINCTCCGPRLTILDGMPYDRERTSMAQFPMCDSCAYEYTHSRTRRFDAQPVCCNECGPEVYLLGRQERGKEAIRYARKVISEGGIIAVKGIGGFHLCCDATREETVVKLRNRKKRPMKPFAVMVKDLSVARRECKTEAFSEEILDGHQKPILLLDKKEGGKICGAVAPDNPKIGIMLPYAPIQLLLFDYRDETDVSDCLVMTSANTSGAPICRDDEDARRELFGLCDVILSHDRCIRIRADDTVMDFYKKKPYMIRRSRGYAPLPIMLEENFHGEVLAVGGELKNTFCIGKDQLFYPSPYIGDMGDVRTVNALKESVRRMEELLEVSPRIVACDLHPAYNTRAFAEELGLPVYMVQHHYAHILSCMAENEERGPVIGVSFDGTGYGTDETIWGGEILIADYDGFQRWGAVESFPQTGGDRAAKEGWRIAVSLLGEIFGREKGLAIIETFGLCDRAVASLQFTMEEKKINTITSTSAGRIFDGISAILGIRKQSTFEGEASMALQFLAEQWKKPVTGPEFSLKKEGELWKLPTLSLVKEITQRRLMGEEEGKLARYFHKELASEIVKACKQARKETGIDMVALSGGVYQNKLLLDYSVKMLEENDFHVLIHHMIPANDGGICLGQAVAAMKKLQKGE